jgi:endonuclease YncB( thermonuclease family)
MLKQLTKKALFKSAFFVLVGFVLHFSAFGFNCDSNTLSPPESVKVKWVYDGDSLLLTDKRKIRIIGIDTPETKHHRQKAQAYGAKAREALRALLKQLDYQVELRYGKERKDKYKRTLAHVYLPDGTNISNWLLEQGFAKTLAFPPNIALAKCYKKSEEVAQKQLLKIWRLKVIKYAMQFLYRVG